MSIDEITAGAADLDDADLDDADLQQLAIRIIDALLDAREEAAGYDKARE